MRPPPLPPRCYGRTTMRNITRVFWDIFCLSLSFCFSSCKHCTWKRNKSPSSAFDLSGSLLPSTQALWDWRMLLSVLSKQHPSDKAVISISIKRAEALIADLLCDLKDLKRSTLEWLRGFHLSRNPEGWDEKYVLPEVCVIYCVSEIIAAAIKRLEYTHNDTLSLSSSLASTFSPQCNQ